MIVKRLEKNGKIKAMYSSSTICGSIYDTTTKELTNKSNSISVDRLNPEIGYTK